MPASTLPPIEQMLDRLFAAPSVSSMIPAYDSSNRAVVETLADWCETLGAAVEVLAIPDAPGKSNLVATFGRGDGGLILAGHTDTVPWDDGLWNFDPLRATVDGDRIYGLGAADMKSFFAIALDVLRELDIGRLDAPVVLIATADEESTMSGARALADAGAPRARHAMIGEPTGLKPVRLHKGIMMEALRVVGRSGHSSDPSFGHNAIEGMHLVLAAIEDWREELQREHHDARFAVPVPTLNFGHIRGGDNPNRIAPNCELQLDLRPLPGMDIDELRASLRERARQALAGTAFTLETEALFGGVPALETPADAEIVAAAERLTGHAAEAVAFATEGPWFRALGAETVILGPGDIAQAHQPDEFLALDRIEPMRGMVRGMVERLCHGRDTA